jgi:hypothetical protein
MTAWQVQAEEKALKPLAQWSGKIQHAELRKLAPDSMIIATSAAWKNLWTAWRGNERLPAVDFEKEFILVATADGPNQVLMIAALSDAGDVRVQVIATEIAGPGFGYTIRKVSRTGIKTVAGKPLEQKSEGGHGQTNDHAPHAEEREYIQVEIKGKLQHGVAAIGGETTGTTITVGKITWELDLGRKPELMQAAERLSGKTAIAKGRLERRQGVEIRERWIVKVNELRGE